MTPQAAHSQTIGLETLEARYRIQSQNALWLANRLQGLKEVKVNYLALPENKYHDLAYKQFGNTAGAMITIDLASEQACYDFINKLKLIHRATNLFDNKTLAIHPYSTIFGNFTPEQKAEMDVLPTTIRISVGLEDIDDLFEDIKQAMTKRAPQPPKGACHPEVKDPSNSPVRGELLSETKQLTINN